MFRRISAADSVETALTVSAALSGGGVVSLPDISPSAQHGMAISGLRLKLVGTVNLSVAASAGNVGALLLSSLKFVKGADTLISLASMLNFQRLFHILGGSDLQDVTMSNALASTGTLDTGIIPISFKGDKPLVMRFQASRITVANFQSGTAALTATFFYSRVQPARDTRLAIITRSGNVVINTDYALSDDFQLSDPMDEVWVDASGQVAVQNPGGAVDVPNITYLTFKVGSNEQYSREDNIDLDGQEIAAPVINGGLNTIFTHEGDFYRSPVPSGTLFQSGSAASTLAKLVGNFAAVPASVVYYLLIRK